MKLSRIHLLLLLRLHRKKPDSLAKLTEYTHKVVAELISADAWANVCSSSVAALMEAGFIDDKRALTEVGRQALLDAVGFKPPDDWKRVKDLIIPALVLGVGDEWKRLKADALSAEVVRQDMELDTVSRVPTKNQVVSALTWTALDMPEKGTATISKGKARRDVISRALGIEIKTDAQALSAVCWHFLGETPRTELDEGDLRRVAMARLFDEPWKGNADPASIADRLAATALGSSKPDHASLVKSLQKRWLSEAIEAADVARAHAEAEPPKADEPDALHNAEAIREPDAAERSKAPEHVNGHEPTSFAKQVQAVADALDDGRYDEDRVFISAVWEAMQSVDEALRGQTIDEFKERLVEANRQGLLELNRADLTTAMDPQLVRASEASYLNATFHFIVTAVRQ